MNNSIYKALRKLGFTKKAAKSIAILDFKGYNIHIAFTSIGKRFIWAMNIKKLHMCHKRTSSSHAEEELIKKINRSFYQNKKIAPISLYSIRINRLGELKCAKPCIDCINHILRSRIAVKEILYSDYDKLRIINPNQEDFSIGYGLSSGREYHRSY
jgi:hypothetical protein